MDYTVRATFTALVFLLVFALAEATQPPVLRGVALVIGQSQYEHLDALPNPGNDARAIQRLLADLGFEVRAVSDRNLAKLDRDIEHFIEDAEGADVALLYYAGHGIEAAGENYLLPIDADTNSLINASKTLVPLSPILNKLRLVAPFSIVLLDACRTSPFPIRTEIKAELDAKPLEISPAGLAISRGFVVVEGADKKTEGETVIGFAAAPGFASLDDIGGNNSPYAAALLKHLSANRGYEFGDVMTMVAQEVYVTTQGRQSPWINNNLRKLVYFGADAEETGDEALIANERRKLLLTIASTPEEIRQTMKGIAASDKVPLSTLYGMLNALNVDVSGGTEKLETQLRNGAENLKKILAERTTNDTTDPELIRLANLAERAEQEGAIKLAIEFRARASTRADQIDQMLDQTEANIAPRRRELAATYANHAETAILGFDYKTAAAKYASAFDQVMSRDTALAFHYRLLQGRALGEAGRFEGDRSILDQSLSVLRSAKDFAPKDSLEWGLAQHALANSLRAIGAMQVDPAIVREAVDAYRAALGPITSETAPHDWLLIQNDLAAAHLIILRRDPAHIGRAIEVVTAVVKRQDENVDPLAYALSQEIAGDLTLYIDEHSNRQGFAALAIESYEKALGIFDQNGLTIMSASLRNKIGNAYRRIAEHTVGGDGGIYLDNLISKPTNAAKAVVYFQAALLVRRREVFPLAWAESQNDLGKALSLLGSERRDGNFMGEAMYAFESALTEFKREIAPVEWAEVQRNICKSKRLFGAFAFNRTTLSKAVEVCLAALDAVSKDTAPGLWAATTHELAESRLQLAILGSGLRDVKQAADDYQDALSIWVVEVEKAGWLESKRGLAEALLLWGERARDIQKLLRAREEIDDVIRNLNSIGSESEKQRVHTTKRNIETSIVQVR